MMAEILICGHLHPDTDSVCSAIALAAYQQELGESALAVRAGELNPETCWALERFAVDAPPEIRDLRTQVQDLELDSPAPIPPQMPLRKAWEQMRLSKVKSLPIVDDERRLIGVVTLGDLAEFDLETDADRGLSLPAPNLVLTLQAEIHGELPSFFPLSFFWYRSQVSIRPASIVFTEMISIELIREAAQAGSPCLVYCLGDLADSDRTLDSEVIRMAALSSLVILITPLDPFTAIRYAQQAVPVQLAMQQENLIAFQIDTYLDEVREHMRTSRFRSYPVVDHENRVLGSISRYHLLQPGRKKVILVDHNERSQSVRGLEQAEILSIIDHHRLGDIQTFGPVYFRNEPVGCTATIIAGMFFEQDLWPSPSIAGLMLCAILSDTVMFKSPTCTLRDIKIAGKLAKLAAVDVNDLGREMFRVGSNLLDKTPLEILFLDFKEFFLGDNKIGVSQISCLESGQLDPLAHKLPQLMEEICIEQRFDLLLFMETDIMQEGSKMYYAGHLRKELAQAFNVDLDHSSFFLPGIMSRKKQVIPALSAVLR